MGNKNWSKMVPLASLASCSVSLGSPVGEAEAVSRYGRGYSWFRGFGLSSRTPRVYSGPYNRGYSGRYSSDRHGYHKLHKKHHQHILSRPQSQHRVEVVPAEEMDRFIPADFKQAGQRVFIGDSVPSLGITEQIVNPSFSVQIDFDDDARDIIIEPLTNSVDIIIPVQQTEPEDLVFNFPAVPSVDKLSNLNNNIVMESTDIVAEVTSVSATQQRLINQIRQQKKQQAQEIDNILNASSNIEEPSQNNFISKNIPEPQNSPSLIPTPTILAPTFKFPPRIPAEAPVPPPVQQPLSVQPPAPNLPPPVLPQAIPAVPGRPVLADNAVQTIQTLQTVQTVQTVQTPPFIQSIFIPMPVPAVPSLSN